MNVLHVYPATDLKEHLVSLDEPCWCNPQRNDEGEDGSCTVIHKPLKPVTPCVRQHGHNVPTHGLTITKRYLAGGPIARMDLPLHMGIPTP